MNARPSPEDVTALLQAWSEGNLQARDRLFPIVYDELKRRAAAYLRGEGPGQSLQPTAIVHEAYLRLVGRKLAWQNRARFMAVASEMMRHILIDRARRRKAAKRSGAWLRVSPDGRVAEGQVEREVDVVALDDALRELAEIDPRQSRIVELRFFGGLSVEETAAVLGVSPATVKREWSLAKAWLYLRIKGR